MTSTRLQHVHVHVVTSGNPASWSTGVLDTCTYDRDDKLSFTYLIYTAYIVLQQQHCDQTAGTGLLHLHAGCSKQALPATKTAPKVTPENTAVAGLHRYSPGLIQTPNCSDLLSG